MFTRTTKTDRGRFCLQVALVSAIVLTGIPLLAATAHDSRLNPRIDELAASNPYGELSLIVSFRSTPAAGQTQMLDGLRGRSIRQLASINGYAVKMAAVDALALSDMAAIDYVTLDAPVRSSLGISTESTDSSGAPGIVPGATGRGVTIAVFDSGIGDHPDLRGSVIASVDFVVAPASLDSSADPFGHGTHVAAPMVARNAFGRSSLCDHAPRSPGKPLPSSLFANS